MHTHTHTCAARLLGAGSTRDFSSHSSSSCTRRVSCERCQAASHAKSAGVARGERSITCQELRADSHARAPRGKKRNGDRKPDARHEKTQNGSKLTRTYWEMLFSPPCWYPTHRFLPQWLASPKVRHSGKSAARLAKFRRGNSARLLQNTQAVGKPRHDCFIGTVAAQEIAGETRR